MTVRVTISPESGFPSGIPGDVYYSYSEDGQSLPATLIPSVYQGSTFSVLLTFEIDDQTMSDPIVWTTPSSVDVESSVSSFGLSWTEVSVNSYRLSGTANNVFLDEYYNFLMKDLQVRSLPAINNEEYLSVVEYHPPATKHTEKQYAFTVHLGGVQEQITVSQNFYWNYFVSLSTFNQAVSKGIK